MADLACQTVLVSVEFSLSSAVGFLGRCCRKNWAAAPAWPVGGGYVTGRRQAYGNLSILRSWTGWLAVD